MISKPDPNAQLCDILLASLVRLAETGETEAACRLAGRAYAALRLDTPDAARRFDVFLHRLTPSLTWTAPPDRRQAVPPAPT
ncbi:hypothetical protein [Nitratireductor alexandrii]|uniref:hypothetical protein n=1 Tax=Nitratireductor alexandrii TaxID=2448161 RepID=UPI000FD8F712|nr:hypothetical protein [Nitratireductor alexandrii]